MNQKISNQKENKKLNENPIDWYFITGALNRF
jgi:hypothetical protein